MPSFSIKTRSKSGSILFLAIAFLFVVIMLAMPMIEIGMSMVLTDKISHAGQAAALAAARELSNIVIADSHWGYVSLSDNPANGLATMAPDQEPLPVTSINTITATVREEGLIAKAMDNAALNDLFADDCQRLQSLKTKLQSTLNESLLPASKSKFTDLNGRQVKVYDAAYKAFVANIAGIQSGQARVKSFKLTLGWLADGSSTVTPSIDPAAQPVATTRGCYKSFVDLPVAGEHFFFAGVADQAGLVAPRQFRQQDGKRFASCVLVDAEVEFLSAPKKAFPSGRPPAAKFRVAAIPYSGPNYAAPGTFVVFLPQGGVREVTCLADLLCKTAMSQARTGYELARGDFPVDANSSLVTDSVQSPSVAQATGRALFNWLRAGSGRATVDSVLAALQQPFQAQPDPNQTDLVVAYRIERNGSTQVSLTKDAGFMRKVIADRQSRSAASRILSTQKGLLCIEVRDQVADRGVMPPSKHGGQPLLSDLPAAYAQFLTSEELEKLDGKDHLRQSYLRGGLAGAIELSCVPADG